MKKIKASFLTAVFAVITLTSLSCSAQRGQIAGGYSSADTSDTAVQEAAKFAVSKRAADTGDKSLSLVSIDKAEQQVIAGMNYDLCLTVNSKGVKGKAKVVVYRDLSDKFELSNWTDGGCDSASTADDEKGDTVTYKGTLEVGKTDSSILYFGEESGDYAAFCFKNESDAGKAILEKCKKGGQCEFTGKVDFEAACEVPGLEADLSARGRIISVDSVKSAAEKGNSKNAPKGDPSAIVKRLYGSEKAGRYPFFQTKDRKLLDEYFSDDLADLLWDDAVSSDGEVGALSFDPLYNAQDMEIKNLSIGKADIDLVSGVATVIVTFKNFGKSEKLTYFFEPNSKNEWKIVDLTYSDESSLKSILFDNKLAAEND